MKGPFVTSCGATLRRSRLGLSVHVGQAGFSDPELPLRYRLTMSRNIILFHVV